MFVDRVKIKFIAGKGGNGIIAWRREKFLAKGGPYGGNGGRGGDIILEADPNIYSLDHLRRPRQLSAENGREGGVNLRQGRSGKPLTIKVPYGTLVKDISTDNIIFDFTEEAKKCVLCAGGKGGKGNNFFKTSTNRAPNKFTPGKPGDEIEVELELKIIADVGLVGMPNAGKSTLMSKITHAHVKIGAYPFTTLTPNLSFVQFEDYTRTLIADIPGILENAHLNKGLGLNFLKHIERTQTLVFVLDAEQDPVNSFEILRNELEAYSKSMAKKPFLVVLNKIDKEDAEAQVADFKKKYPFDPKTLFEISALEEKGLDLFILGLEEVHKKNTPAYKH